MEIVIFWILFGVFSAMIASGKNRSGALWFFIGLLFGPFGLLVGLLPKVEDYSPELKAHYANPTPKKKRYNFVKMKGKFLSYDSNTGKGVIAMENKEKLDFDVKMWDDPELLPTTGMFGLNIYNKQDGLSIMSSSYELEEYENKAKEANRRLNYNIKTKVTGVTSQDDDGRDRQTIVMGLVKDGNELFLKEHEYKQGRRAIAVLAKDGDMKTQIGDINTEIAVKLLEADRSVDVKVIATQVTGGTMFNPARGVNIEILSSERI